MKAFVFLILLTSQTFALEAIDAKAACDRFLAEQDKKNCIEKIEKLLPDSYLAAVCQMQFDDKKFYACMEVVLTPATNPNQLEACSASDLTDERRLACVQAVASTPAPQNKTLPKKQRLPAKVK